MDKGYRTLATWILVVSGFFALMEIAVSVMMFNSPELVMENLDINARGVQYVVYMWAARQFALGFIFGFATYKKSAPMLLLAYIFFLVMFIGDTIVAVLQKQNTMIIMAIVMCLLSAAMIFMINKGKTVS